MTLQDYIQKDIERLEGQMRIEDYPHYDEVTRKHCLMDDKKFNQALQTIINIKRKELEELNKGGI